MPRIQTFDAGNLGLQPSEIGVESVAAAARRQGAFYSQQAAGTEQVGRSIGQMAGGAIRDAGQAAVDYLDHQQISHGAATFAELTANKTDEWNNVVKNADPNDPSVGKQFLETSLEPALEKFRQGFMTEKGQAWAESHIDALRQHMFQKTASDMSTLAGQAAHENARQVVNQLSNAALNDPTTLDFALKTVDSSIEGIVGTSPNLKGTAAGTVRTQISEQAREQIVKSAALGYIMKTAEVPPWASDLKYSKYINGIELKQFQKAAEAQQKSNLYYEKQTQLLQKQQADLAVHKDATDLMANSVKVDPNDPNRLLIAPDFMQRTLDIARRNPDAPSAAATIRTLADWAESQHGREAKIADDPVVRQDLFSRMGATENPTTEIQILRADADHKLSPATRGEFLRLQKAIQERPEGESIKATRNNFNKSFDRLIDGMMNERGEHSLLGSQRTFEFQMAARRQEQELIKQGKDPGLVYDPRPENPYYFGRPENIASYRVTAKQALDYEAAINKGDIAKDTTKPTAAPKTTINLTGPNTETLPRVRNKDDYDKLAPGAKFTDDNGNRWTKPEKK